MQKFLIKFFLFIILLGSGSTFLSFSIDEGLKKTRYSYFAQWNDLFDSKIDADLLVIGSSRARQHFSTSVFDSVLNVNSYVIGIEGYRFKMYYDLFTIYLQHNRKPKYLVISMDIYTLHEDNNSYYYQQFLPYLNETAVRNAYKTYSHPFIWADYYLPLYKYRGERTQITVGILEATGLARYRDMTRKGFASSTESWNRSFDEFKRMNPEGVVQKADPDNVILLNKLMAFCTLNGIVPILAFSPEYIEYQKMNIGRDRIMGIFKQCAGQWKCFLGDYSEHKICYDTAFFYNSQHMNNSGSELFSKDLAFTLKKSVVHE